MLKLPREEQIQKLRDLQQIVLQERRNRLKNAKSGFTHAQLVEAGKARLLHIAYHKRGKLPGDELALQWLQTSWLEAKDDLEAAEKMFLYERRRLEVHRREILPQFEARALQIFGLVSPPFAVHDRFALTEFRSREMMQRTKVSPGELSTLCQQRRTDPWLNLRIPSCRMALLSKWAKWHHLPTTRIHSCQMVLPSKRVNWRHLPTP